MIRRPAAWATKAITAEQSTIARLGTQCFFQVRLVPAKRDGVKVEVEGVRRASPGVFWRSGAAMRRSCMVRSVR